MQSFKDFLNEEEEKRVQAVWENGYKTKGYKILGRDREVWQNDSKGNKIKREHHGRRDINTGWEIDHIKAKKDGGGDELSNLRPLQWQANLARNKK